MDFIQAGEYWDHHYCNFPSGFDEREKLTTLWYHDPHDGLYPREMCMPGEWLFPIVLTRMTQERKRSESEGLATAKRKV